VVLPEQGDQAILAVLAGTQLIISREYHDVSGQDHPAVLRWDRSDPSDRSSTRVIDWMATNVVGDERNRIEILGIPIENVSPAEAAGRFRAWLGGPDGRLHQVSTVNPEFIVAARRDPEFRSALLGSYLSTADGVGVVLAARILGRPLRGRLTGVELVETIAGLADPRPRLFLLGAAEGVAEEAAARLVARYPGCQVTGCYSGSPAPEEVDEILTRIRAAGADTLLVAFGAPAQEKWIARYCRQLAGCGIVLAIGVGGTFDYLAGRVPRAPRLIRRAGFEWLYRLVRQPWRWRRQLALPWFVLLVLRERLFRKGQISDRTHGNLEH
jgi:N-acetylglucosaminyldiphosphoundecaprenol N-acetyl-beta-D-mannosaminyltransferase